MKPLSLRKQLLIAESELNRAQLMQEWQGLKTDVDTLADQAGNVPSLISAAVLLFTGLTTLGSRRPTPAPAKKPWWQSLLKGAQMAGTIWSVCRPATPDKHKR